MMNHPIASDLSYAVMLKRQAEQNGRRDVPTVKAPAEKPAKFVKDARLVEDDEARS